MKDLRFVLTLFAALFFISCNTPRHNRKAVESAMHHYDDLILHLDADGISKLFMPDGNLGDIAIGRDSIKKFLSSFKNITVLSQASTTSSIDLTGDTAIQKGNYTQSDLVGKDTFHVKGIYIATWQRVSKKGWLIQKMATKSQ